jgi:hypothetical protein
MPWVVITFPGQPASIPSELTPSPGALAFFAILPVSDLWERLCAFPNGHVAQIRSGSLAREGSHGNKPDRIQQFICSQCAWAHRS